MLKPNNQRATMIYGKTQGIELYGICKQKK